MVIYEFDIRNCNKHDKLHAGSCQKNGKKGVVVSIQMGFGLSTGQILPPWPILEKTRGAITAPLFVLLYLDGFSSFKTTRFHIEASYCWLAPLFEDWI
jgi:hypothetical protein